MTELLKKLYQGAAERLRGAGAEAPDETEASRDLVILGALLHEVAAAHGGVSQEEERELKRILREKARLSEEEAALTLAAAREAGESSLDLQGFTREVNKLPYPERVKVVELLFEVALADSHLHEAEHAAVRRIAELLWVAHEDFIGAKLKVKNRRPPDV